jgi:hypothetical protein
VLGERLAPSRLTIARRSLPDLPIAVNSNPGASSPSIAPAAVAAPATGPSPAMPSVPLAPPPAAPAMVVPDFDQMRVAETLDEAGLIDFDVPAFLRRQEG